MTTQIFPTSPVPAGGSREPFWNSGVQAYDSGVKQGVSYWSRPLYEYKIPWKNIEATAQSSLESFYNSMKASATPFFFGDPYDHIITSASIVSTGTAPTSFYMYDVNSYRVYPASGNLTITSALSGTLTEGTDFSVDHETGIIVASLQPTSSDYWYVSSAEFFKKCRFADGAQFIQPIWGQFSIGLTLREEP